MRGITGIYGVLAAATLAVGCSSSPTEPQISQRIPAPTEPILRLVVTPSLATLNAGGTVKLSATAQSGDRSVAQQVAVSWLSSDALIATVSADGVVRGIAPGRADIQVRSGTSVATARITVLKAGPSEIACLSVEPKKGGC